MEKKHRKPNPTLRPSFPARSALSFPRRPTPAVRARLLPAPAQTPRVRPSSPAHPLRVLTPLARRPLALGPHDSTLPRTPFARSLSCLTATRPRLSSLSSPRLSLTRRAAISGEIPSWTRTPRPGLPLLNAP